MGKGERWLREVALTHESDSCLLWPFYVEKNGYARIGQETRRIGVHVFVCLAVHGHPPSPAHEVAHSCGARSCCNKRHVRWATCSENMQDKYAHGRMPLGESHPKSTISDADAAKVREARGYLKDIAAEFGMSIAGVHHIRAGRTRARA